jgi:hypothetical protein
MVKKLNAVPAREEASFGLAFVDSPATRLLRRDQPSNITYTHPQTFAISCFGSLRSFMYPDAQGKDVE